MTPIYKTLEQLQREIDEAKRAYLRRFGWKQTCQTPGSYWMWRRDFSDVNERRLQEHKDCCAKINHERDHYPYPAEMLVDTDTAVRMTWLELDPLQRELFEQSD